MLQLDRAACFPQMGGPVTWALVLFMLANTVVSAAAVYRMSQRYEGIPAVQSWQVVLDEHYPDEKLAEIYPSMVRAEQLPAR